MPNGTVKCIYGTLANSPPESLVDKDYYIVPKSDMWAAGYACNSHSSSFGLIFLFRVVLYELIARRLPFIALYGLMDPSEGKKLRAQDFLKAINETDVKSLKYTPVITPDSGMLLLFAEHLTGTHRPPAKSLVELLLNPDPEQRPSATEALNHPVRKRFRYYIVI
jgi:serine/threonine protein kinase